jgi:histidinol phosphatase-like PHP family hydrolase
MNNIWWWFPEKSAKAFFMEYLKLVEVFVRKGVKFSLGSDAHSIGGVGNLHWSQKMLKAANISSQQIFDPMELARRKGML